MSLPEFKSEYSPTYKRINVGGLFGKIHPVGLQGFVYSEELLIDKVLATEPVSPNRAMIKRTVECELIIDPMQMKSIQRWLNQKIAEYEKIFGQIPSPEEVESRARRDPHQ